MPVRLRSSRETRNRVLAAAISGVVGLALATVMAGPASADPPPTTPPPALTDFTTLTSTSTAEPASTSGVGALATAAAVTGKRQTFTRGGALAWSSDTFEWYWSGSKMTSSSAFQSSGYVFPNTVTLMGVKRTLATSSEHLWRATAAIGAGVVTPWGTVDVYSQTITDYFTLVPNKLTHSDS